MKLVTFNDFDRQTELAVNCDKITVVRPMAREKATSIFFDNTKYVKVSEDYEVVKRKIQE